MFRTLAATAAVLAGLGSAHAGVVTADQKLAQHRATVETAYAAMGMSREAAEPLVDYAAARLSDPGCTPHPSKTYAVVVGVNSINANPRIALKGAENDADLIAAAFKARFPGDLDLVELKGDAATRDSLRATLLSVVAKAQCGDLVTFYFGGHATYFGFENSIDVQQAANAIPKGDAAYDHARTLLKLIAGRAAFFLSGHDADELHPFSAVDLSEFVTNVRNRKADVMVVLDAAHSGAAALLQQQQLADPVSGWSDRPDTGGFTGTHLVPDRGEFAAFYSSVDNRVGIEKSFTMPDGTAVVHGNFSFAFAEALQDSAAVTASGLADRLHAAASPDPKAHSSFSSEGSNPGMVLFGRAASLEHVADAIHITSPEPTRGPASVKSSAIEIAGTVSWTSPVTAVLVNGELAELGQNGRFTRKLALVNGANTIRVVALTRDNLLLQKSLDVVFAGDVDALKGSGKRYAVIIGNADYGAATGFNALATPIADADALEAVLTGKYGFTTAITLPSGQPASLSLRNASGRDTQMALYNVSQVAGDNDTVLIYYAGHGIYEPMTTTAFWVPTDAVAGVPPTYLSASTISEAIARIQARKVLLISDSCFSGALLRGGPAQAEKIDADKRLDALLALQKRKSRILISSGNNEPVSDAGGDGHSIFAQALLNGLDNEDHDEFSARELFDGYILTAVAANSKQEPQFRPLDNVGHDGGDVIFLKVGS
jgi:hypothetical protein